MGAGPEQVQVAAPPIASGPATAPHVEALDGVRGLAVLMVMLHHFVGLTEPPTGPKVSLFRKVIGTGWMGVDIFFVLSGFLITGILLDTVGSRGYFRTFYARRSLRIFPLYYAALAVAFLVAPALRGGGSPTGAERYQAWLWLYGSNFLSVRLGKHLATREFELNHFWSLAIEEQFYLVWPAVVLACRTRGRLAVAAAAVAIGSCLARPLLLPRVGSAGCYMLTWCRLDVLAAGALLAIAARSGRAGERVLAWARPVGLVAVALLLTLAFRRGELGSWDPRVIVFGYPLVTTAAAGLVAYAATAGRGGPLSSRVLGWFGRRSYGLYVYHGMLRPQYAALAEALAPALPRAVAVPAVVALGIAACGLLAEVSSRWFERPIMELKRYFLYRH